MKRICVIGDYIHDKYKWCEAPKICPEAPALVLVKSHEETRPGGMGNVVNNLKSLSEGKLYMINSIVLSESVKTRYFVGHHLMFREDEDRTVTYSTDEMFHRVTNGLKLHKDEWDAVIVSDYAKSGMPVRLIRTILDTGCPVFVDTKSPDPQIAFSGAFCILPNEHEHRLLSAGAFQHIVRKLGSKGCLVDETMIPTEEQQVYDVTGAGDVFLAAFVFDYLEHGGQGMLMEDQEHYALRHAAGFANRAAGFSVRKIGSVAVRLSDIPAEVTMGASA